MTAVQSMCDRVIHLENGTVKADGDAKEIIQEYLSLMTVNQTLRSQLQIGQAITIKNIGLFPNPVESGTDLRFQLTIIASRALQLSEVALIVYALEGPRVGTVDLRPSGFPFALKADDCLQIQGVLQSIPLVERQYRVALWIDSGVFIGELTEMIDLTVAPALRREGYVPPRPEVRGWVDFKTKCSCHLDQKSARAALAEG
jgi:hypothetical protein